MSIEPRRGGSLLILYRLLKDVELFEARLDKIQGFDDVAKRLVAQVKAKQIKQQETVAVEDQKADDTGNGEKPS